MPNAVYTGHLKRGDAPDTITGEIVDSWGWVITLTGTRNASGGYTLSGVLGETPPSLRLPDDPRDATEDTPA